MKDSPLINKSKAFALNVLSICKQLRATKCEPVLINQFIRSGTSIGANIREAFYAHGKADFISKLQIALKNVTKQNIGLNFYWMADIIVTTIYRNNALK